MNYYFLIFFMFSFFGFILETLFAFITRGVIENRKTMRFLPLCPVYGLGAIALIVTLNPFKSNPFIVIFFGMITGAIIEYIFGFLCERIFNVTLWSYSDLKSNYKGLISLSFTLMWGALSLILIYFVFPAINIVLINFPVEITNFLLFIFLCDLIFTSKMLINIGNGQENEQYDCPVINQKSR